MNTVKRVNEEMKGRPEMRRFNINNKKYFWRLIPVILISLFSTRLVYAIGDHDSSRASLQDLKKFSLYVAVNDDGKKAGLSEEKIYNEIKQKLQKAGIIIFTQKEFQKVKKVPKGNPHLHFDITLFQVNDKEFAFTVTAEFRQKTFLKRDTKVETLATTWAVGKVGFGTKDSIFTTIKEHTENFINAYFKVNPKVRN